jgi:hypothetical protein
LKVANLVDLTTPSVHYARGRMRLMGESRSHSQSVAHRPPVIAAVHSPRFVALFGRRPPHQHQIGTTPDSLSQPNRIKYRA